MVSGYASYRESKESGRRGIFISSMASKPINIGWFKTGYKKIMYSIVLQTIFHEYLNKNHKIINLIFF